MADGRQLFEDARVRGATVSSTHKIQNSIKRILIVDLNSFPFFNLVQVDHYVPFAAYVYLVPPLVAGLAGVLRQKGTLAGGDVPDTQQIYLP